MAAVVFMRGVNVGGRKSFRPAAFAKELSGFDVVNIGAAGTFIVRKPVAQSRLRAELLSRLPFEAEVMICRASEIMDLVSADPFSRKGSIQGTRRFVTVLAKRPRTTPRLPLSRPTGKAWQVKVMELRGKFALSLWRRTKGSLVYPNEVVEKELAVAATTRTWGTVARIYNILRQA
jgi:uncharacterized protein (DUF1697 family)